MRVWQTGTYPGSAIKFYGVAYPERSCLGVNLGRELTVENINLTSNGVPIFTVGRFYVMGIYITKNYGPTLEILAPKGGRS
jgi:hypothetical protein